ncbi:hypothetical protein [Heyndrickxia sp. FSL W8-0423]|uniref:hypothetical protein n=1 Tax=Heyndrickxia sp. FSL W8-0423 TaxID=2921601 RepID=UPI0030F7DF08
MVVLRKRLIEGIPYLLTKFAGAGFLMFVISNYVLLVSGIDMYEFVEGIANWFLWGIVFGYGILCSLFIDLYVFRIPKTGYIIKIILYIVAGYAFFIISAINVYTLFAGTVGALCSLIFYFGTYLSSRFKSFKYVFSFVIPLTLIILMNVDFTEKEQWVEVKSDHTYNATFDYFNGKHEIPVQAKAGQTITLYHEFNNTNGGGHGFHVLNEKNKLVGITEVSEGVMKLKVQVAGVYRIVVTGDDVKGSFKVTWK